MTFDVSTVTVWKLQAVSFRHLIALACMFLPSSIAWRFEFGAAQYDLLFKTMYKKAFFYHLFFFKDFFKLEYTFFLLLIKRTCTFIKKHFVLILAFFHMLLKKKHEKKEQEKKNTYFLIQLENTSNRLYAFHFKITFM